MELSPTKLTKPTMNFGEAMNAVKDGKSITKLEWNDVEYYGALKNAVLVLHKPDNIFYPWTISEGDLNGTDWITL